MSFSIFGSYFPAWVACLLVALMVVAVTHVILRLSHMLPVMPKLPIFYLLTSLFAGMTTWLIFFAEG